VVAIDVGANHPAVEAEHRLLGADQRHRFVVGRAAVRGAVFLPRLHITRFDTPGARAERGRRASYRRGSRDYRPSCRLIGRQYIARMPAAGIAGAVRCCPPWRR
jgi:hypothetical protein